MHAFWFGQRRLMSNVISYQIVRLPYWGSRGKPFSDLYVLHTIFPFRSHPHTASFQYVGKMTHNFRLVHSFVPFSVTYQRILLQRKQSTENHHQVHVHQHMLLINTIYNQICKHIYYRWHVVNDWVISSKLERFGV